jgi:flagellar biosynthetic protein FliO
VLSIAMTGLVLVTVGRGSESHGLYASMQNAPADSTASRSIDGLVGQGAATMSILKMLAALAVVIALIYLAIYLLKKFMGRGRVGGGKARVLEILETAYIDPKKSLSLVRVADKSVLIGVTDNQISMLTELDAQKTLALFAAEQANGEEGGFAGMLRSAAGKLKGLGGTSNPTSAV